jgi:plasmid stability protein
MRITVRLDHDLLKRAEIRAAAEGRTLSELIEEGLRAMLEHKPDEGGREWLPLPTSKAKGGLLPGVDLTRFSGYQEMEDLEYIERLKKL